MSYTVDQLSWAIQRGSLHVTAEIAASLVLSVAEQLRGSPRWVTGAEVTLVEAGSVLVSAQAPSGPEECDGCLRTLLREVIRASGGEHPAIDAVCHGIPRSPAELADQLRIALIPLNRSAIRRGLTRLHRRLAAVGPPDFVRNEGATPRVDVRAELALRREADRNREAPVRRPLPPVAPASRVVLEPGPAAPVTPAGPPMERAPAPREYGAHTPFLGTLPYGTAPRDSSLPPDEVPPAEPAIYGDAWERETPEPETLVRGVVYDLPPEHTERAPSVSPHERELFEAPPHTPRVVAAHTVFEPPPAQPSVDSPELAFGRFSARRSQVSSLVAGFSLETPSAVQSLSEALRRCFDAEAEAAVSCTPPPAHALQPSGREAACGEPRRLGIGV